MRILRYFIVILAVAGAFLGGLVYERTHGKPQPQGRRILHYVDPMHPAYTSDKPGVAPDCGMKLVPVYADEAAGAKGPAPGADLPMGTINISSEKQQLIGVRYGFPEMTASAGSIRAVGKVAFDETRLTRIHSKVEGWIEKVHVDFTGAQVKAGQPLLTIYSPEMLASEQEFLLALKARDILSQSSVREASTNSISLVDASRRRLELWDLSAAQIKEVEETGKPIHSVTLYSPAAGFIIARNAFPSQKITPETELYSVADLSRVWIMADVYEADIDKIRMGQSAIIGVPSEPGRSFAARVDYIQPQLDATTRTLKIRLEAPNPNQRLKPEMFVDVDFHISGASRLTVPSDAVMDSGVRKTVFVDRGDGYLEPRAVETGDRFGDRIEIRSGLKMDERIVTSGTFLIDSESQLKSAAGGMAGHQHGGAPSTSEKPQTDHSKMPGMAH
jgi:Cu(I)/Ag(I) efflux system membrane fusion protein